MAGETRWFEVHSDPRAVRAARERVLVLVRAWDCDAAIDDLLLCLSEVLTNAIVHSRAGGRVTVFLRQVGSAVRVDIVDGDARRPRLRIPAEAVGTALDVSDLDESGRGLFLVGALSSRWGVTAEWPTGKRVWFEIDVPVPVSAPAPVAVAG